MLAVTSYCLCSTYLTLVIYTESLDSDLQQLFSVYIRQSQLTFRIKSIIKNQGPISLTFHQICFLQAPPSAGANNSPLTMLAY